MTNNDNPIDRTINDVLGLGHAPKTFSEKIEGLRKTFGMPEGEFDYIDAFRADKGLSSLTHTRTGGRSLFNELHSQGLIPASAETLFRSGPGTLTASSVHYNESTGGLFYRTGNKVTSLPTQGAFGGVNFGGRIRKVNSLLQWDKAYSFIDEFYGAIKGSDNVHADVGSFHKSDIGRLMQGGVDVRGMYTPEEAFWTSRKASLDLSTDSVFGGAHADFHLYESNMAALTKTAGRYITPELEARIGKTSSSHALSAISGYKSNYLSSLKAMLGAKASPSSYVFTKPEYLGHSDNVLVGSSQLTDLYGSRFEEHTLKKGLFQLAKMKHTGQGLANSLLSQGRDPTAPFVLAGQESRDLFSRLGLRVGVVDTTNSAFDRMYFQEGGALITDSGAKMFAQHAPMGTLTFSSPSEDLIRSVERTFNINMGAGDVQSFSNHPRNQLSRAHSLDRGRILKASGSSSGLVNKLNTSDNRLAKIELSDSSLSLSFETPDLITPHSSELNISGQRLTGVRMASNHPLRGMIPKHAMEGMDIIISSEVFGSTLGTDTFLTNFVEKVRQRDDAASIFKQAFGHNAHIAMSGKTQMVVSHITSADDAFKRSFKLVEEMAKGSTDRRALANEILSGTKVALVDGMSKGVEGLRVFGMGGASRTDFLIGDINMMKPVTITPTKLGNIALGSRALGYGSHAEDPLFNLLAGSSKSWGSGSIGIAGSGKLQLGSSHLMSRYSNALQGNPGIPDPSSIVTMSSDGGFMMGGEKLKTLPDMKMFAHARGVDMSRLEGTLLGQKKDLLYLDLGKTRTLNLLGTKGGETAYRYVPIPLPYLRTQEGVHNRIVVGQNNPTHGLLESLVGIDRNRDFHADPVGAHEGSLSRGYFSLNKAIGGKEGIFEKSNTILMPLGTRARLAPQSSNFFDLASMGDAEKLYTQTISGSDYEDWFARKSGGGKGVSNQIENIRGLVDKQGYFYSATIVDPMQRAEHANVMKTIVDYNLPRSKGIGQLNLNSHPFWYLMSERDTDRDAISVTPLSGMEHTGKTAQEVEEALQERWLKQQKLSKHFMWFYKHQLMTGETPKAEKRLSALGSLLEGTGDVLKHLGTYLGISKSQGYSTIRATEPIMSELVSGGIKGARGMGIKSSTASDEMLEMIAAPYVKDPLRGDAAVKAFQNIYQSPVQKAGASPLEDFNKTMIGMGEEFADGAFDYDAVVGRTKEAAKTLLESSSKVRGFTDVDYLYNNFGEVKESLDLMKADLDRGAETSLHLAARAKAAIIDAQSTLIAERIGPAQVLAASQATTPGTNNIIEQTMRPDTTPEEILRGVIGPGAGGTGQQVMGPGADAAAAAAAAEARLQKAGGEATESFASKAGKFFTSSKGKTFGAGVGVGALLGAGIVSTMSGPEAPMPREVDSRQPTDRAPDIFSTPPRIYGNNQSFGPSRRGSPATMNPTEGYNFPSFGNSSITIRDQRGSSDAHMINRHMRDISNSDYVY
tara:strand:+ start:80305 stop:84735 length:4431 start_codon:yes stop_codon:yes gene_type:complete